MSPGQEFEERIKQSQTLIYNICRLYAFNEEDRKDLFQEIVIQLWKAFPTFRGEARFSTWLYRVALNTAITGLRRQHRREIPAGDMDFPALAESELHDPAREANFVQMYQAIARLNEIDRAIIALYLEDRSYQEMEQILGIREGNLRVKMSRIKKRLRGLIKTDEDGAERI